QHPWTKFQIPTANNQKINSNFQQPTSRKYRRSNHAIKGLLGIPGRVRQRITQNVSMPRSLMLDYFLDVGCWNLEFFPQSSVQNPLQRFVKIQSLQIQSI